MSSLLFYFRNNYFGCPLKVILKTDLVFSGVKNLHITLSSFFFSVESKSV